MTDRPNPQALEAACAGFYNDPMGLTNWHKLCAADPALADKYRAGMNAAVSAYLAAATPGMDTDTLACKIMWKDLPFGGNPDNYIRLDANAAHAVIELLRPHLAALPARRTITTVEELDALPVGTVLRVARKELAEIGKSFGSKTLRSTEWTEYLSDWGTEETEHLLPATVLHVPAEGSGE